MTNCPDCNSRQRFASQIRSSGRYEEIYIRCFACGYELVVERYLRSERMARQREIVRRNRALRRSIRSLGDG